MWQRSTRKPLRLRYCISLTSAKFFLILKARHWEILFFLLIPESDLLSLLPYTVYSALLVGTAFILCLTLSLHIRVLFWKLSWVFFIFLFQLQFKRFINICAAKWFSVYSVNDTWSTSLPCMSLHKCNLVNNSLNNALVVAETASGSILSFLALWS